MARAARGRSPQTGALRRAGPGRISRSRNARAGAGPTAGGAGRGGRELGTGPGPGVARHRRTCAMGQDMCHRAVTAGRFGMGIFSSSARGSRGTGSQVLCLALDF